jgi:hypothetical protein
MKDKQTCIEYLTNGGIVNEATLHYATDSRTVECVTFGVFIDGQRWRASINVEELATGVLELIANAATKKQEHKTHTGNRKTYLSGLAIPFATLVQG